MSTARWRRLNQWYILEDPNSDDEYSPTASLDFYQGKLSLMIESTGINYWRLIWIANGVLHRRKRSRLPGLRFNNQGQILEILDKGIRLTKGERGDMVNVRFKVGGIQHELCFQERLNRENTVLTVYVFRPGRPEEEFPVYSVNNRGEMWRHPGLPEGWGLRLNKKRQILELR